jgi:stearoyl-CoA desaturase (delta-9 desaturase)
MINWDVKESASVERRSWISLRLLWVIPAVTVLIPFIALLAIPVALFTFGIREQDWASLLVSYCLIMLGTTLGYHRTLAHRSLALSPIVRYPLFALGAMAGQGPPSFWVAHHRAHHGDSDGPRDPHSPLGYGRSGFPRLRGFLHAHVGWMFGQGGRYDGRLVRELRRDPAARCTEDNYFLLTIAGLLLPACVVLCFDPSVAGFLKSVYWAGLVRVAVSHQTTWLVNSACHLWGYRNFDTADSSRNNWIVAALTLGEGWHNNHHAEPSRVRHGLRWWELDPTYALARFFEAVGLARDMRR